MDLICIQESNLISSSSFRISEYSALRSHSTHSSSGIFSPQDPHASGGVIIFVMQGLFFSELFTNPLSLLDSYCDHIGVNISLNNSSSPSFLNTYDPPIPSSLMESKTGSFSLSIFLSSRNLFVLGNFNCHQPLRDLIESSPLTTFLSMTLTRQLFSIASLEVAPLLTSPSLPSLLLLGRASGLKL